MKYSIFFIVIAVVLGYWVLTLPFPISLLLLWPIVNMLLFAIAYAKRWPWLILGKSESGHIYRPLLLLNLPWLLVSWIALWIQSAISSEPPFNRIGDTNFYIGRCPFPRADLSQFFVIIDLTAEFPHWYNHQGPYVCYPNLDGVPLIDHQLPMAITNTDKVLIHCAQGHGRSATYASLLLGTLPSFAPPEKALNLIQQSRPAAIPCRGQLSQIRESCDKD